MLLCDQKLIQYSLSKPHVGEETTLGFGEAQLLR